ncbi:creatininase family protein [Metallosphaera tengchongensis]|uniref:Creatininase family protein n=1 Tax=Metallosphaera tengchongensis TaxID=1532350 RepID=A0A6N0NV29_9CREN|nr:creatininase family protein [Metallosphaera tengchongensis]QKQ99568.1 creatininase family protein [Metallosphaera tengchongensis]
MRLLDITKDQTFPLIGVLPVGSVEQHGPHLPMGTDSIISEMVAKEVERRVKEVLILPTFYFGCSFEHGNLPHVSLDQITFISAITDILTSCKRLGLKGAIIINGHGGNSHLLETVSRRLNFEVRSFKVMVINLTKHRFFREYNDLHAGTIETSIMKFLFPDLVKDELIPREVHFAEGTFETLSSEEGGTNGVVARGKIESKAELGKVIFEEMVNLVISKVQELRNSI